MLILKCHASITQSCYNIDKLWISQEELMIVLNALATALVVLIAGGLLARWMEACK